jgi:hypothetical protein
MPVVYPVTNPSMTAPNAPSQAIEQLRQLSYPAFPKRPNPGRLTESKMPPARNDEGPFPNNFQAGTPYSRNRG